MRNRNILLLFTIIVMIGCGQTYNSNTLDRNLAFLGSFCNDASDTRLCAANEIIITKCVDCHEHEHDAWAAYKTNSAWTASDMVKANNTAESPLIQRLTWSGSNMPVDKAPLTEEEYNTLKDWINNL